jgi:hypothetical protein
MHRFSKRWKRSNSAVNTIDSYSKAILIIFGVKY